jgi:hypothetical protein
MMQVSASRNTEPARSNVWGLGVSLVATALVLANATPMRAGTAGPGSPWVAALLSLRDDTSDTVVSSALRDHFWLQLEKRRYRVSRMREERPGRRARPGRRERLAAVTIESEPVAQGDDAQLRQSWLSLLRIARAHYGVAMGGSGQLPEAWPDSRGGSVATHVWRAPGLHSQLEARCVARTPRGGRTCSAVLGVAEAPAPPASH